MIEKSIHIDPDLESRASAVLNNQGIDINDAITDYLTKIAHNDITQVLSNLNDINNQSDVRKPTDKETQTLNNMSKEDIEKRLDIAKKKGPRAEAMGILEGLIQMSDDFDEPLELIESRKVKSAFLETEQSLPRSEVRGILEGIAWISDDFNDPFDDLDG